MLAKKLIEHISQFSSNVAKGVTSVTAQVHDWISMSSNEVLVVSVSRRNNEPSDRARNATCIAIIESVSRRQREVSGSRAVVVRARPVLTIWISKSFLPMIESFRLTPG